MQSQQLIWTILLLAIALLITLVLTTTAPPSTEPLVITQDHQPDVHEPQPHAEYYFGVTPDDAGEWYTIESAQFDFRFAHPADWIFNPKQDKNSDLVGSVVTNTNRVAVNLITGPRAVELWERQLSRKEVTVRPESTNERYVGDVITPVDGYIESPAQYVYFPDAAVLFTVFTESDVLTLEEQLLTQQITETIQRISPMLE